MKVLLDLDTGIDDGMALAYTVGNKDMELIGVTGTYGNVYTENGVQNVLNLLNMLNEPNIPVFAGVTHAIYKDNFKRLEVSARIHGENGIGQVRVEQARRAREEESGVDFIIESVRKYKKELTIIATGPMSNLAAALLKAPEIKEIMGRIVIMGGALTIPGNVTAYAEANISQDPQAAKLLFESGLDITMVGLDVTQRSQLTKEDTKVWRAMGKAGSIYADMVDYYISQHKHSKGTACHLHDPSAAICAIHPEYFHMIEMHMTVITEGEAAGRTIGDPMKLRFPNPTMKICIGVDSKLLQCELQNVFAALFQKIS